MRKAISILAVILIPATLASAPNGLKARSDFVAGDAPSVRRIFTLDAVVAAGLDNNPDLQSHREAVKSRKAAYEASRLLHNPTLGVETGEGRPKSSTEAVRIGGLSLSQTIENPVKRTHRIRAMESEWLAAEHELHAEEAALVSEIKILFARILHFRRLMDIARSDAASLDDMLSLIRRRVDLGESRELEALKIEVEALRAKNVLHRVEVDLQLAREELNDFLGGVLPPEYETAGDLVYEPEDVDEAALLAGAVLSHPLVLVKESETAAARSRWSAVRWQRLPDPVLSGFAGEEMDGRKTGFGLSFEIPLWNFGSRETAEAAGLVLAAESALQAVKIRVAADIRTRVAGMRLTARTLGLFLGGLLTQADESLRIAEVSYRQGELSLLDYLDSRRTHLSILRDYEEALLQWQADKAGLEKALGIRTVRGETRP
jgi:outer membrane protein, heavy metal efflux system